MSAYIALCQPDAAHLFTDGASYRPDGVLARVGSKVRILPNLSAAITSRGTAGLLNLYMSAIGDVFRSFDSLVSGFDRSLELAAPIFRRCFPFGAEEFEFVVVGWSESRDRAEVYYARGAGVYPETEFIAPAGHLIHIEAGSIGSPDLEPGDLAAVGFDLATPQEFVPEVHGLMLMEAMRQKPGLFHGWASQFLRGSELGFGVGGFVEHTEITREGARSQVLRVWPDVIGEKINPLREVAPALLQAA